MQTYNKPTTKVMMTKTQEIRNFVRKHGRTKARSRFSAELKAIQEFFKLPDSDEKTTT